MPSSTTRTEPKLHFLKVDGLELAAFEWSPDLRGQAPTLFFSHATGFHGRVFDQVLARLGPRHVVSVESRGHGRSENYVFEDWDVLEHDLVAWIDRFEIEAAIGIGHSAGGHAMVGAAARRSEAFERLLLIDPVIKSPSSYSEGGWNVHLQSGSVHPTAKRKNHFASPTAMFERFKDREPYKHFDPEALRDYCTWGLLPNPAGAGAGKGKDEGYVLACPPETEASIYTTSSSQVDVYENVRNVQVPVMVMRAKRPPPDRQMMDFSSSPTWPGLAEAFAQGRDRHLRDHTHFIPMEDPALVARYIETFDPEEG